MPHLVNTRVNQTHAPMGIGRNRSGSSIDN
jgi:hypothetical protein